MMANDDRHGRRPVFLFVLAMDLPVVSRRHAEATLPWTLHHVALEGDIVKAFIGVLHHRGHVDVWRRIHGVMADDGKIVNVCLVAALDDLFNRRLAARNRYRSDEHVLTAGVL